MTDYLDVPEALVMRLRAACAHLPEAYEEQAWAGVRWRIRGRTLVHLVTVSGGPRGSVSRLTFHCVGEERDALLALGHPFHPGWGDGLVALVVEDEEGATDWDEVRELVSESYRLLAPKKLIARLDEVDAS